MESRSDRLQRLRRRLLLPPEGRPQITPQRRGGDSAPTSVNAGSAGQPTPLTFGQAIQLGHRLRGLNLDRSNTFIGSGTRSDPLVINEQPPKPASTQSHLFPPLQTSTTGLFSDFLFGDQQLLHRIGRSDPLAPNLTADGIRNLVSNIRPDEDIHVNQDANIGGLAPQVRLMKHQLVTTQVNCRWD
jgi:hypothetical protein